MREAANLTPAQATLLYFLMSTPPPRSTLFPYTTLFRSAQHGTASAARSGRAAAVLAIFAVALGGLTAKVPGENRDRKSTRLNSSHSQISYAVFCLKKKNVFGRTVALGARRGRGTDVSSA